MDVVYASNGPGGGLVAFIPLLLVIAVPVIIIWVLRKKDQQSKEKVNVKFEVENIQQKDVVEGKTIFSIRSSQSGQNIDPKYYKWLICSVIGSIIIFGGFIYTKGGDIVQLSVILIYWGVDFINVVFWSAIVSVIAKSRKKNWRNAFIGTSAIMLFIQACITLAQMPK